MNQTQLRSERLVIHAILANPACIHDVMSKITSDMIELPVNRLLFENITELYIVQQPINLITLAQHISQSKSIYRNDAIQEMASIHSAFDYTQSSEVSSAMLYLIGESIRHEHIDLGKSISAMAESEAYDPKKTIDKIQAHIADNRFKAISNKKEFTNEDLLDELGKRMADASKHQGISGIQTGYSRFDTVTSGMQPTNFIIVAARPAMGKELKNSSKVYTPNGFIEIGSAKAGDKVLGSDGRHYNITGVFPQGKKDAYRVWFDDGSYVDSGLEHQWEVTTRKVRKSKDKTPIVVTTRDMLDDVLLSDGRKNYSIRICEPLQFKHVNVEINPYLLGFLIGDGHLSDGSIAFSNTEKDVIEKVGSLLPGDDTYSFRSGCTYGIKGGATLSAIRKYGLHGTRSYEKFIPNEFLYNSIENRVELLRGLIDSDGYCVNSNSIEYSTTSEQLCKDILELVRGLGGKSSYVKKQGAYIKDGKRFQCREYYRMYISMNSDIIPASSSKHLAKYQPNKKYHAKFISRIEKLGYQEDMTCISVDAPDCLYVTDGYTLTHNTQYALGLMCHASVRNNYKGLFISCEMDEVQVMKRVIAVDSGIPGYHLKRGNLERHEIMRYEKSRQRIIKSNLKIVAGSFTISDVLSLIYKMKYSEGLDYVVIDYIQKITSPGAQNRTNEVGDVSRRLKDMANELKIPVVALAQLSRAVEHRTDKKPMLSDLRESGDIEQDADIVMFLYRAGYYMDTDERMNNPASEDGYAIIAKHRDGELEDIHLKFDGNVPAWKNPNDRDEPDEDYIQTAIKPSNDFDIF